MTSLAGKIALVTGSRRGIGRLVAEHLLERGATVVGFARGEGTIEHAAYRHYRVDVADPAAVQRAFGSIAKDVGPVQIVVNNAAVLTSQYAMIMPPAAAQEMLNVNLLGPFMVSREAAKMMRRTKWGRIVNIGSMAASLEPIGDSIYAATKAGVATLANVLAKELGPLGVTCNTLAVTAIDSEMLAQLPRDKVEAIIQRLPVPRFAEADDILNVLDFLVSDRSGYITAQTIWLGGIN
ncbi:SDR family oxidoreductase [Sphingomonas sp. JC676]|uniref:SDR family NAD(P)-dependent oxidoreductase n=1 Tax=Sphingomonas sp. JC676 TaxID=2768065 RepID=UPI0016582371|nr:SDR family NAD(P)-dependent oxidoreductase [Sphingomonas sp. JC676]MBC9030951.1 SDR family oxidoreductase [Sphingomonas sp. JC676]